ncbi:MAG TPA: hypothetical protein VGE01_00110, partial [Fimbriimonas sp.]
MATSLLVTVLAASFLEPIRHTTGPADPILPPPEAHRHGGFYTQCAYFHGMPILASDKVDSRALRVVVDTFEKMLSRMPEDWVDHLAKAGSHYSIIAEEEGQTDLPEYRHLKDDPKTDWNKRARGLGGLNASGGEENILELPSDRYKGESIFIHEFAHTLDSVVLRKKDPGFRSELRSAYDKAMAKGLWKETYAATNPEEYWAEGVQTYFDCNRRASPPNGIHNEIGNREELRAYDEALFRLLDRVFGSNPWRYEGSY